MRLARMALVVMVAGALGCAGSQPFRQQLAPGARIGVLNVLEPQMTHINVGALRFDGFTRAIDVDWDIPGFMDRAIQTGLRPNGNYQFIPLGVKADPNWKQSMSSSILRAVNWRLPADLRAFLENAAVESRLDAIVAVSSFNSNARPQDSCFSVGKDEVATQGYGLFTWQRALSRVSERVPFGQNTAAPFANILVSVFHTQPAALAAFAAAPCSDASLPDFPWEGDLRTLSPTVIRQLKPLVEALGAEAARTGLRNAGLLP